MSLKSKALFLDRDGVINKDTKYCHKVEEFEFIDGIFDLVKRYQDEGYLPIIVTNQSGIGRGYYTQEDYMKVTEYMVNQFLQRGIKIEAVYHCPHTPEDKCSCRKPRTGMFMAAKKAFRIDMKNSIMIGDKHSDIQAAKSAKIKERILVSKDENYLEATKIVKSLKEI
jgi:D-glycero-D-manno-heptose 1,7-bisphosphate phosphatase